MKIKLSDLVLEVGSGDNPNPRTDILCDRYLIDNRQRAGNFPILIDRPFVVGDAHSLPFKDNNFDYVICAHILEHLEDPLKFLKEVVRVGKAGFIETPSVLSERLFGWDFHFWFCYQQGKTLVLTRKKEGERFGGFFHRLIKENIWFRRFFEKNRDKFYTAFEWQGEIKAKVSKNLPSDFLKKTDNELWKILKKIKRNFRKDLQFYFWWIKIRAKRKIRKETRKIIWLLKRKAQKKKIIESLLPLLICPSCKGKVILIKKTRLVCLNCDQKYPLDCVIPIMLTNKERKKGY